MENTAFDKLFASTLTKLGMKESSIATKVFTYGNAYILDKDTKLKLSDKEVEVLKEFVKRASFKIIDGQYGARCGISCNLGDKRFWEYGNLYDENYNRDFSEGDISEEDKQRVVVVFYEKGKEFRMTVFMMDNPPKDLSDIRTKLNI